MKLPAIIPTPLELGREALIVIGGAVIAAIIVSQLPGLQAWLKLKWNNAPHPFDANG